MSTIQNHGTNPYLQLSTYGSQAARQTDTAAKGNDAAPRAQAPAGDSVELSAAARTTTGGVFGNEPIEGIPPLADDRLNEIRQRIDSGFYNQPDVLAQTASQVAGAISSDA